MFVLLMVAGLGSPTPRESPTSIGPGETVVLTVTPGSPEAHAQLFEVVPSLGSPVEAVYPLLCRRYLLLQRNVPESS
jgi:hypothetical protein